MRSTTLELARLFVSALTPILLFVLGLRVAQATRRLEDATWSSRKLIERRLELHQDLAPKLNDLYCFFQCVGHFRALEPPAILQIKRDLDRTFFAFEQLFGRQVRVCYREFMSASFAQWANVGQDSRIKLSPEQLRRERGPTAPWQPAWDELFDATSSDAHKQGGLYMNLMLAFGQDVGVVQESGRASDG